MSEQEIKDTNKEIVDKDLNRRNFIKIGGIVGAGTVVGAGIPLIPKAFGDGKDSHSKKASTDKAWRMIIDVRKCVDGCEKCVTACRTENNVYEDKNDPKKSLYWMRKATISKKYPNGETVTISAPLLCNQCDNPPCATVCPVEATFQRPDGVVDVDKHRCIGCRYCVIGCPYDARVFNFYENHKTMTDLGNPLFPRRMHGVAESCNFCDHRIDMAVENNKHPVTACQESCTEGAIVFGDLNDKNSNVSKLISKLAKEKVIAKGLREDLGTKPKLLYVGL